MAQQVLAVISDPKAPKDRKGLLVKQDQRATRVTVAISDLKAFREFRANAVKMESLAQRVIKVTKGIKVSAAMQALKVCKAPKESVASLVTLEQPARRVHRGLKV